MSFRRLGIKYRMLPAQEAFHRSRSKYKAYVGGYGSGKTYAGCHEAIRLSVINRGLPGMVVAPTYGMLEDATLPVFLEILDRAGIAYTWRRSSANLLLPWGSKVMFRSADSPERLKGPSLAWAGIDEGAMVTRAAWEVLISRIRHPEAKRLQAFITTTPEGYNWLFEEFVERRRKRYRLITASTRENIYLPPEYAEDLVEAYGANLARQYVSGEFVNPGAGRVYDAFSRERHVRDGLGYDPAYPLSMAVDFNVDPLHAALIQIADGEVRIVDEIVIRSSNTWELCEAVRGRYRNVPITAYPDPTGRARKTAGTPEAPSDFAVLSLNGFTVRARSSSPPVRDRVNAVNRILAGDGGGRGRSTGSTGGGPARLVISSVCRESIRSFERTCWKDGLSVIDKSHGDEHMTDAVGYFIEYEFPVRAPQRVEYEGFLRRAVRRCF